MIFDPKPADENETVARALDSPGDHLIVEDREMIDETGPATSADQTRQSDTTQSAPVVDRTIRLQHPIEAVRTGLASVLAAPVVVKKGSVYRQEYAGQINGDDVELGLVWRHRRADNYRRYNYLVRGRLRADSSATILEIEFERPGRIGLKWSAWFLLAMTMLSVGLAYRDGLRGMELLIATIGMSVAFGLFVALYYLIVALLWRSATKDLEAFLKKSLAG